MNYQKLDASLISAMEDSEVQAGLRLSVFVRFSDGVAPKERVAIAKILGDRAQQDQTVMTASLERSEIAELSDRSGIQSIHLAQQYYPRE